MPRQRETLSIWTAAFLAAMIAFGPGAALADTIRISGTGGAIRTMRLLAEAFRKNHPKMHFVFLPSMGSSGAVRAVLAGRLDIGLCGRPLKEEERAGGGVAIRYARTPFAFGVNRAVKRTGLTEAAVAAIYSGKQDRWQDGSRIRLVLRPTEDSDINVLQGISPEMHAAVESATRRDGMLMALTDHDAADAIENVPGAFGGVTLAIVVSEKRAIRILALNGVMPSLRTLADGRYPYSKTFSMVTRKDPPATARKFIDFVRSPAGAAILAKNGQSPAP